MRDALPLGDDLLGVPEGGGQLALLHGGLRRCQERGARLLRAAQLPEGRSGSLRGRVGLPGAAVRGEQRLGEHLQGGGLALGAAELLGERQGRPRGAEQLLVAARRCRRRAQQRPGHELQARGLLLPAERLKLLGGGRRLGKLRALDERASSRPQGRSLLLGHPLRLVQRGGLLLGKGSVLGRRLCLGGHLGLRALCQQCLAEEHLGASLRLALGQDCLAGHRHSSLDITLSKVGMDEDIQGFARGLLIAQLRHVRLAGLGGLDGLVQVAQGLVACHHQPQRLSLQ
mmetsp:Transcript_77504/g.205768  ORF Transcript_77504/g.205768 Transcript_77504/m.205768 type:complete len:286 (+) Transcript_77504:324-1181(+)